MAAAKDEAAKPKKRKGTHGNQLRRWLLTKQKVEVRSTEDGFLGSWHRGEVIGCGEARLRIKYEEVLSNNGTDSLVEWIPVSPVLSGLPATNQYLTNSNYRGNVRPVPPQVNLSRWSIHYGKCVDLQHEGAWWEGVIFDHEDGCDERIVFFPDMGDEMTGQIKDLRVTQDWDEVTGKWRPRGDWLLLELIEEVEQKWPLLVSVKQLWYDLRGKESFRNLKEWTSPSRQLWKELLLEVLFNNLKLTVKQIFHDLNELEDMKQEAYSLLEFSELALDVVLKNEAFCADADADVSCGPDPLFKEPQCFSDSASPPVEMEIEPHCLALGKQDSWLESNNLNSPLASPSGKECALPVLPPNGDHVFVIGSDLANRECPLVSLGKPVKKLKHATRRTRLKWLPAGQDLAPEAEYCPSAITDYIKNHRFRSKDCTIKLLKARKHLTYLGWKIEFARDGKIIRMRYTSPSNVICFSLLKACLMIQPESAITSSNSEANTRDIGVSDGLILFNCTEKKLPNVLQSGGMSSYEYVHVESHYCPQAVVDYSSSDNSKHADHSTKVMISKAKKHLAAIGWRFYCCKRRRRMDMQYVAPSGRAFYSLRQACKWSMRNGRLSSHGEQTGELAVKALALPSSGLDFGGDSFGKQSIDTNSVPLFSRQTSEQVVGKIPGTGNLQVKRKRCRSHDSRALLPPNSINDPLLLSKKRTKSRDLIIHRKDVNAEHSRCVLRSRQAISVSSKQTPRTILSWLIDGNVVLPGARVYYRNQKDVHAMKEGRITREGIKCICCQCVFTPSKFEAHAGSSCNRPTANIFLEDGRTLLECQLQLKHDNSLRSTMSEQRSAKGNWLPVRNDHVCSSCNYGGVLILCDGCPSSFHASCIGLKEVPDGDWFCPLCCCHFCLRRFNKYSESRIAEKALRCGQCEQRYHVGCFRSKGLTKLDDYPKGNWFCSSKCKQIYFSLQELLGKPISVGLDNLTWTWLKYTKSEDSNQGSQHNEELMENYSKLNVALSVMHECFEPVKELLTRRDLVKDVIFNRWSELQRLNFQGFYTVLLERDEELITVATVRVHGDKVAEVPLIATRFQFRRLGMCRILMDKIEKKLLEFGVESLVLPAVPSVLNTWTTSFGFSMMTESERLNFMRYIFLGFHGTVMCRKLIKSNPSTELKLSTRGQQSAHDKIRGSDSIDVERNNGVSVVLQADQIEGSDKFDEAPAEKEIQETKNWVIEKGRTSKRSS